MALAEAWGAGWGRPIREPVHLVDWPPERRRGSACCGRHIELSAPFAALWPVGTADRQRVPLCGACRARRRAQRPTAAVIPLTPERRRRRTR